MVQKNKTMLPRQKIILSLILILFLSGCHKKNRFHITTFENPVEVKINRFDLDFIALDTTDMINSLKGLEQKHPAFYPVFLSDILMMNPKDTIDNAQQISNFLADTTFVKVHQKVKATFQYTDTIEAKLSTAYSYLKHYFPDIRLPEIYFYVSGFNHQYLQNESLFGIGSEMYLGAAYPTYREITHEYLISNMRKEMIAHDVLSSILHNEFNFGNDLNMLNVMIYEGKIVYLLSIIMPDERPENLMGYSTDALEWCKKHEKHIWGTMIENKHLYSTDHLLINQYVNDGPFTAPVSQKSPGRLGVWMGWQIVQSYMQNNKDVSLDDLMTNDSAQQILEQSLYRP